ncbi:dipeptidase [Nocardioides sp. WS12]|uniref:dipeptidase n=1 Tax=Nocardioides sp. WS12 TaxID=2486272 RepID=UPI0015FB5FDB|nr:dipeptidase [Nocardioides sp. WS12]
MTGHDHYPAQRAAELTARVEQQHPQVIDALRDLIRIPSVSAGIEHRTEVVASAELVAAQFRAAGCEVDIVEAGGHPSVIAHRAGPEGAPTVLLYAHHDVQPTGDPHEWDSPPFEPTQREDRLFARGAADDKAGVAVHLAALLAHGDSLPVSVTVLIDGEEEIGSPTLADLIETHHDRLTADVIVIADALNWAVGTPALTRSLRGLLDVVVDVATLDHPLHSGAWGGPVPDALGALITTLASLWNTDGSVAVAGVSTSTQASPVEYDDTRFRTEAGLLDGVALVGDGPLTDRLWHQTSLTVTTVEGPPVAEAANSLTATARAKISVRLSPGDEVERTYTALVDHLQRHVPHGAHLTVTRGATAEPAQVPTNPTVQTAAMNALRLAWDGAEPVEIGCGGTLPLISLFKQACPDAAVLVTGVEDPDTRAHGTNESLHLDDFRRACIAEALLLQLLSTPEGTAP